MDADATKLKDILNRGGGQTLVLDQVRCRAFLRDLWGPDRRKLNLLLTALEEGVPARLSASSGGAPATSIVRQLVRSLSSDRGLETSGAHWAVETWALALGRISARTRGASSPPRSSAHASPGHVSGAASSALLPERSRGVAVSRVLRLAGAGALLVSAVLGLRYVLRPDPELSNPDQVLKEYEARLQPNFDSFESALSRGDATGAEAELTRIQSDLQSAKIGDPDGDRLRQRLQDGRSRLEQLRVDQEYARVEGQVKKLLETGQTEEARILIDLRLDQDPLPRALETKLEGLRDVVAAGK